jgi:hypothetical protein
MNHHWWGVLVAAAIAASAQDKQPSLSIAVMDFEGRSVPREDVSSLADRFRSELTQTERYQVMERAQMDLILQEQEFQKSDCVSQECAVQAGQLIAVSKIVTGTVAKVGGIYTLNVRLLDVATGKVDMNVNEDCDCPIEKVLTETINRLARKLVGLQVEEAKAAVTVQRGDASLYIKSDPADASVYFDGKMMDGRTPVTLQNLTQGRHLVRVTKADMVAKSMVDLESNKIKRLELKLEKQQTILKILSNPSDAEVYLARKPGPSVKPVQLTPAIFEDVTRDTIRATVFKVGFRDTNLVIPVTRYEENSVQISLHEATADVIKQQKRLVLHRRLHSAGIPATVLSAACLAVAGGLYLWAQRDYGDATAAKDKLDASIIKSGPDYAGWLDENRKKTDSGNLKSTATVVLGGASAVGIAVGIVLVF